MHHDALIQKFFPGRNVKRIGNTAMCEVRSEEIVELCRQFRFERQLPLIIITASDDRVETGNFSIAYVFGVPTENFFIVPFIQTTKNFPSLTSVIQEASIYERKIKTFFGLTPENHPNPRSLILHENWPENIFPLRKDFAWNNRPPRAHGHFEFRQMLGDGIYEIPVGPVHAGIIEPGHFRFSVAGEEILMLEPRLGYSHKGSEKLFEVLPLEEKVKLSERISGDSSFSHSLCFCQALEMFSEKKVPERAKFLRSIFAELERIANHLGDIGAIMTDTGFNFGGAQGARLREIAVRINESLTGSRFLRGVNAIGGVTVDIDKTTAAKLAKDLGNLHKDFYEVMTIVENSSSLLNRLKGTGILDQKIAIDHGVRGVVGRAVGLSGDTRFDFPYAAYEVCPTTTITETDGDVYARFRVRVREAESSFAIIDKLLREMPDGPIRVEFTLFAKNSIAVSLVEGWRGEIVYVVRTDKDGVISRVDVRDPSFLNWTVLGYAGLGNMVPDFPLINKSFNLSYSGNDL